MDKATQQYTIVTGLNKLDEKRLREIEAPPETVEVIRGEVAEEVHGEFFTAVAIFAAGMAGLRVLSAWLLKGRNKKTIERTFTVRNPDGSERVEHFKVELDESSPPEEQVLKALTQLIPLAPPPA